MSVFLYNIFISLYGAGITIASLFNSKARRWKDGRRDIISQLLTLINTNDPVIWMHCASLGEFEQGRPVLEALRKNYPQHKFLLTFFSPSGYEVRKNYAGADWVCYLPLDTPRNVTQFLNIVNPSLVIFVKYEYWYNYLHQLHLRKVPTILISAIFRPDGIFFKWYGGVHRKMLRFFNHIFVQDAESRNTLLPIVSAEKITVAGDTRFDRVATLAASFQPLEAIQKFVKGKKVLVAGSTWPKDEKNLKSISEIFGGDLSLIIAPHEVTTDHLKFLTMLFPDGILYSDLIKFTMPEEVVAESNVLIINNIGMLSKLYHYSDISYVGGGFNRSGIHNTLEAAVYDKPVVFGENYQPFREAVALVKTGGGFSYTFDKELFEIIKELLNNEEKRNESGKAAGDLVRANTGATNATLHWLTRNGF